MEEPAATIKDTPHSMLPDDMAAQRAAIQIDLKLCNVLSIHMAMNEFEQADGLRFDQWPGSIRARMEKDVAIWRARNPTAVIKAMTQAIESNVCILALHWRPKGVTR